MWVWKNKSRNSTEPSMHTNLFFWLWDDSNFAKCRCWLRWWQPHKPGFNASGLKTAVSHFKCSLSVKLPLRNLCERCSNYIVGIFTSRPTRQSLSLTDFLSTTGSQLIEDTNHKEEMPVAASVFRPVGPVRIEVGVTGDLHLLSLHRQHPSCSLSQRDTIFKGLAHVIAFLYSVEPFPKQSKA